MDLIKKLNKIFEALEPEPLDEPEVDQSSLLDEPDTTPEVEVPSQPEGVQGAGPAKQERTSTEAGLKSWYGLPPAKPGKTFDDLKKVIGPLNNGWTQEEVIVAMQPSIMDKARKYGTTPAYTVDDAVVDGMQAVIKALETDKSIAPFTTHVFRRLDTVMSREAAKLGSMRNGTDQQTYGGKLDWRGKTNQAQSLDVPDETGTTAADNLANTAAADARDTHLARVQAVITKFIDNPAVELSTNEKLVLRLSLGLRQDGTKKEPTPTAKIAALLGQGNPGGQPVSAARISQIRASAMDKIKDYVQFKGMSGLDSAEEKMGMRTEAKVGQMLIALMKEAINTEIDMLQKYHKIPLDTVIEGNNIGINVIVAADGLEVVDAVDRFDESILSKVPSSAIHEAKQQVAARTNDGYYADVVESITIVLGDAHGI